jgi:photosystem II stability/assembly factor-like uncharacterized protein
MRSIMSLFKSSLIISRLFSLAFYQSAAALLVTVIMLPELVRAQTSWTEIPLPVTDQNLSIISFVDSSHGCLLGNDRVFLYTSNNGSSWSVDTIPLPPGLYPIKSCELVTDSVAWVFVPPFKFFRTTDRGRTWTQRNAPDSLDVKDVVFTSTTLARFITHNSLWTTTNAGETWFEKSRFPSPGNPNLRGRVAFFSDSVGFVGLSVTLAGPLIMTTDRGQTWTGQGTPRPLPPPGGYSNVWTWPIRFVDDSIGTLGFSMTDEIINVPYCGLLLSWNRFRDYVQVGIFGDLKPEKGFALDRSNIWVLNYPGNLQMTTNGGNTWLHDTLPVRVSEILYDRYGHRLALGEGRLFQLTESTLDATSHPTVSNDFVLGQNYPNPFNPSTEIRYQLPEVGHVMLKVFDLLGREVATLVDEVQDTGSKLVMFDPRGLATGVYYYTLVAGDIAQTKMMILIR